MNITKRYDLRFIQPSESECHITEDGTIFFGRTGGAAGAYDDDGRTVIVPAGGNGSTAWVAPMLQNSMAHMRHTQVRAVFGTTTISQQGMTTPSATGTATAADFADTSFFTRATRVEALDTTAGTDSVAGYRSTLPEFSRRVGFNTTVRWGQATGTSVATRRGFAGMIAATDAPTDVDPSTLVSFIAMAWDDDDANVCIKHNDATGAATSVDLGSSWPKPAADRDILYELDLKCAPNGEAVTWRVTNLATLASATGVATTNLPAIDAPLCGFHVYTSVGGTSGVSGVALCSFYGEKYI